MKNIMTPYYTFPRVPYIICGFCNERISQLRDRISHRHNCPNRIALIDISVPKIRKKRVINNAIKINGENTPSKNYSITINL